ncbi:MAG: putative lipid II flippase FtsW [Clostridia bacterium]|nr:putative lipid II flippase FtsW [Clostridia bacterium]
MKHKALNFDISIGVAGIILSVLGLLFIYDASSYSAEVQLGDAFHYVKTQAVALFLGVILMFAVAFVDIDKIKKASIYVYICSLILLGLVFVPVLGVESYGAKRWLNLGFFTIQPSEYAKFGMVIFLAKLMADRGVDKFFKMLGLFAVGGVVAVLLLLEPNMSITICVLLVTIIMIFVGGAKIRHLLMLGIPLLGAGVALILAEPYRIRRLFAFVDPWASPLDEGYQLIQSYYALGSGGLFGVGIGNSRQKFLFLPFAESDFILSVIGEETGLVGILLLVAIFLFVVIKGFIIASRAKDRFSCYVATGISAVIAVQTALNIAVVCGAIPPTGLPLPFISAGGSSLVAYMLSLGVLMNISRQSKAGILSWMNNMELSYEKRSA